MSDASGPEGHSESSEARAEDEDVEGESRMGRFRAFWARHRRLFWILHSVWGLSAGTVVLILARERYGFVPWVMAFLALTWASTLFFATREGLGGEEEEEEEEEDAMRTPGLMEELTSFATRNMYQETLFFLLPFYAYSTVVRSPNVLFTGLLAVLAFLSCMDLIFDRWLRQSPVFGLVFFGTVAFAGLNLVLPMVASLPPDRATPAAAVVAVVAAGILAWYTTGGGQGSRLRLALAAGVILLVAIGIPRLVPPVPLRLDAAHFAVDIDRSDLTLTDTVSDGVSTSRLEGGLVVLAEVFAPSSLPTLVSMEWILDGESVRTTREIEVIAHAGGFRVWDALRPTVAAIRPGTYRIVLRSDGERVFGVRELQVGS